MELDEIEEIALLLREHPVSEICIEGDGTRIRLRKSPWAYASPRNLDTSNSVDLAVSEEEAATEASPIDLPVLLESKMVGLFHHLKPAIRVGAVIHDGQVVGHVELMKLMNDVVADSSGTIVEVLIEDGSPVEYGLPLFRIEPA